MIDAVGGGKGKPHIICDRRLGRPRQLEEDIAVFGASSNLQLPRFLDVHSGKTGGCEHNDKARPFLVARHQHHERRDISDNVASQGSERFNPPPPSTALFESPHYTGQTRTLNPLQQAEHDRTAQPPNRTKEPRASQRLVG